MTVDSRKKTAQASCPEPYRSFVFYFYIWLKGLKGQTPHSPTRFVPLNTKQRPKGEVATRAPVFGGISYCSLLECFCGEKGAAGMIFCDNLRAREGRRAMPASGRARAERKEAGLKPYV